MNKKQEWREKYKAELAPKFTPNDMADEKMTEIMTDIYVNTQADFFYSLHLQEISKIRERLDGMKRDNVFIPDPRDTMFNSLICRECGMQEDCNCGAYNKAIGDTLLAITDENHE